MFNNGVGGISDVLNFQDIVQGPEKQQHKNYFVEQSLFRSDKAITFHTSEVLCQVEGSDILEVDGFVVTYVLETSLQPLASTKI